MSHARLSPSSASRWTTCPGSLRLISERNIQDKSGLAAEEGTAAHELLEECLLQNKEPKAFKGTYFNKECKLQPGGFLVDDDMIDAVKVAVDYTNSQTTDTSKLYPERKINPGQFFGRDDCHGTADITIIDGTHVKILDYKHGRGIVVEVEDNLQALLYAIGVVADLPIEERKKVTDVELGIIQPRAPHPDGPIRTLRYSIAAIYGWVTWFAAAAAATDDPGAPLNPGDKQCTFCPVKRSRGGCPAMRDVTTDTFGLANLETIETKTLRDPKSLTPYERRLVLDNGEIIMQFVKAVMGQAQEDLKNGRTIDGFKLVRGRKGNKEFKLNDEDMIKKLSSMFGLKKTDVLADPKLLGVTKVMGLAKKSGKCSDAKLEKLNALIEQKDGKLTMAPNSDPRPAAGSQRAVEAFKDIIIE